MGTNAYFAFQVVGFHGIGPVPYRLALAAVFIQGFISFAISLLGLRQWLVNTVPNSIKVATVVGIGLFLAEIGLTYSSGIGAITRSSATLLSLGGCPIEYLDKFGECTSHKVQSTTVSN
jgi:AGZA family xanthine/uracil permease-like MFS transporter